MALPEKQLVPAPFTKGVDTKTNPLLSAKPSRAENMVVRGGTLEKRPGTRALTTSIDAASASVGALKWWPLDYTDNGQPNSQTSGEALFPFYGELVRLNGGKAYALGAAANQWTQKAGTAPILTHTVRPIVRRSSSQSDMDHAYANGVTVTAWVDSGVHVALYDESTGDFYQTGATALSSTNGYMGCRCVALGKKVLVFFAAPAATLKVAVVDTTTPSVAPVVSTLQTDLAGSLGTGGSFDAVATANGYAVVAYITGAMGSEHWTLFAVGPTGAALASPAKTDMGAVGNAGAGNNLFLLLRIDANGIGYALNFGSSVYFATFTVGTGPASTNFPAIAPLTKIAGDGTYAFAATAEAAHGNITVFASGSGASNGGSSYASVFMTRAVVGANGLITASANIPGTGGLALQSDGFVVNGVACCMVVNDASYTNVLALQPTAWVLDVNGNAMAKVLPGLCQVHGGGRLCRPFTTTTGAIGLLLAQQGQTSYTSSAGNIISTTPHGVARADVMLSSAANVPTLQLGEAVYIGGSLPRVYDGQEVVEAGHNIFPEGLTATASIGSNLSVGTYQYKAVYTWVSARGEFQRSAPSPAATVAITAGAANAATIAIPTQRLTGRDIAGISTTQIEVYRTEANGLNFYRVSSVSSPLLNNNVAATVSFTDSAVTDAALVANELLYTTGGVNDCIAPPAFTIACAHKTRLVVAGLDNPHEWRSSSQEIPGEMLRFNEAWGGRVPPETGKIKALASMDGNLVIFTESAGYLVPGDGPDLLGNNNWPDAQLITSVDAGALSQAGVLSSPAGVFCQTSRGWKLLTRELGFEYIGADVESYGQLTARCATLRPELEEVWFQCDDGSDLVGGLHWWDYSTSLGGVCLVYNYRYQQWGVLTNYGAQGACYYQGNYTRVRSDGAVLQETPGAWLDSGNSYSSAVETQWIRLAGLQGFQRVWRALLVGLYGSDFTLTWEVAYDYSGQPQSPVYATADALTLPGAGTFTPGNVFQWRRHMRMQKCEAVKFRFTDSSIGGNGKGMALTDVTLEVGIKRGGVKLPAGQST